MRVAQGIGTLGHGDAPEIRARGAVLGHVRIHDQGECRVRAAKPVGVGGIQRKPRKRGQKLAETVYPVGIARDTRDDIGIARLHRARRAPRGDNAAGPAHRDRVEIAQAEPEMLGQAHWCIGKKRKGTDRQPVDLRRLQPRRIQSAAQPARDPPMGGFVGIAHIGHASQQHLFRA